MQLKKQNNMLFHIIILHVIVIIAGSTIIGRKSSKTNNIIHSSHSLPTDSNIKEGSIENIKLKSSPKSSQINRRFLSNGQTKNNQVIKPQSSIMNPPNPRDVLQTATKSATQVPVLNPSQPKIANTGKLSKINLKTENVKFDFRKKNSFRFMLAQLEKIFNEKGKTDEYRPYFCGPIYNIKDIPSNIVKEVIELEKDINTILGVEKIEKRNFFHRFLLNSFCLPASKGEKIENRKAGFEVEMRMFAAKSGDFAKEGHNSVEIDGRNYLVRSSFSENFFDFKYGYVRNEREKYDLGFDNTFRYFPSEAQQYAIQKELVKCGYKENNATWISMSARNYEFRTIGPLNKLENEQAMHSFSAWFDPIVEDYQNNIIPQRKPQDEKHIFKNTKTNLVFITPEKYGTDDIYWRPQMTVGFDIQDLITVLKDSNDLLPSINEKSIHQKLINFLQNPRERQSLTSTEYNFEKEHECNDFVMSGMQYLSQFRFNMPIGFKYEKDEPEARIKYLLMLGAQWFKQIESPVYGRFTETFSFLPHLQPEYEEFHNKPQLLQNRCNQGKESGMLKDYTYFLPRINEGLTVDNNVIMYILTQVSLFFDIHLPYEICVPFVEIDKLEKRINFYKNLIEQVKDEKANTMSKRSIEQAEHFVTTIIGKMDLKIDEFDKLSSDADELRNEIDLILKSIDEMTLKSNNFASLETKIEPFEEIMNKSTDNVINTQDICQNELNEVEKEAKDFLKNLQKKINLKKEIQLLNESKKSLEEEMRQSTQIYNEQISKLRNELHNVKIEDRTPQFTQTKLKEMNELGNIHTTDHQMNAMKLSRSEQLISDNSFKEMVINFKLEKNISHWKKYRKNEIQNSSSLKSDCKNNAQKLKEIMDEVATSLQEMFRFAAELPRVTKLKDQKFEIWTNMMNQVINFVKNYNFCFEYPFSMYLVDILHPHSTKNKPVIGNWYHMLEKGQEVCLLPMTEIKSVNNREVIMEVRNFKVLKGTFGNFFQPFLDKFFN